MTEPSPSPIPTTSSSQSWLDSLDPLNHLWKEQPFVAYVITALALPLAIWLGKRAWKTWERRQRTQRITARKQQLPPVRLPFTVEVGYQRLTLEPAQPQQNFAPEGMSIVRLLSAKSTPAWRSGREARSDSRSTFWAGTAALGRLASAWSSADVSPHQALITKVLRSGRPGSFRTSNGPTTRRPATMLRHCCS